MITTLAGHGCPAPKTSGNLGREAKTCLFEDEILVPSVSLEHDKLAEAGMVSLSPQQGKIPKSCYCSLAGTFFQCYIYFQGEAMNSILQCQNKQFVLDGFATQERLGVSAAWCSWVSWQRENHRLRSHQTLSQPSFHRVKHLKKVLLDQVRQYLKTLEKRLFGSQNTYNHQRQHCDTRCDLQTDFMPLPLQAQEECLGGYLAMRKACPFTLLKTQ